MRKLLFFVGVLLLNSYIIKAQETNISSVTSADYKRFVDTNYQDVYNHFYLSLNGGLHQFYGDISSDIFFPGSMMKGKIPWAISPRIGWDFNPRFGLRADFNMGDIWAQSTKPSNYGYYFHASMMDLQGDFIINMTNLVFPYYYNKKWNMTIFVGAGWMWFRTLARNPNDSIVYFVGYDKDGNKTKRESDRVWNAGFSFGYKLTKRLDLNLEVKFNNTPTDKIDGVDHVLSEFDNYSTTTLGLTYYLGKYDQEWKWNPMEPFFENILDSIMANNDTLVDLGNQVRDLKYCCEKANEVNEPDDDQDSVPNSRDLEPNTPKGSLVNWQGKAIPVDTTPAGNSRGGVVVVGGGKPGQPMYFNSIYFDFDKSDITKESYAEIVKLVQFMNANPGVKIMISGNTDIRGTNTYNEALGQRRVNAAKRVLINDFGFKEENFTEQDLGEYKPISDKVHWVNRRVDFWVVE